MGIVANGGRYEFSDSAERKAKSSGEGVLADVVKFGQDFRLRSIKWVNDQQAAKVDMCRTPVTVHDCTGN